MEAFIYVLQRTTMEVFICALCLFRIVPLIMDYNWPGWRPLFMLYNRPGGRFLFVLCNGPDWRPLFMYYDGLGWRPWFMHCNILRWRPLFIHYNWPLWRPLFMHCKWPGLKPLFMDYNSHNGGLYLCIIIGQGRYLSLCYIMSQNLGPYLYPVRTEIEWNSSTFDLCWWR
jgi:hypothetical protein